MKFRVSKSRVGGKVVISGSKSHTMRALFIAGMAEGASVIRSPLISGDTLSAVCAMKAFGADIHTLDDSSFQVRGFAGNPHIPEDVINTGNSGTTLRFGLMTAGLCEGYTVLTGDAQVRKRPLQPLISAMNNLGGRVFSTRGNGMAPVIVKGSVKGGKTLLDAVTSQFLSSMLISCPLLKGDTEISITRLNEAPYVDMTLWWLDKLGIEYENADYKTFKIKGGQSYKAFDMTIPGDFSSATFFAVLAAVSGGEIELWNLNMDDPQGDRHVFEILSDMGTHVAVNGNSIKVKGGPLKGIDADMNSIPDALPALAVAACFAQGETRLYNVPQARLKETDRISVMCNELKRMGADVSELSDGLLIRGGSLKGCMVEGYGDHRVVMALTIAGLNAEGETVVDTAEAADITFPNFYNLIKDCGGSIERFEL